jgi:hypothetical protein
MSIIWSLRLLKSLRSIPDLANLVLSILGVKFTMRLALELAVKLKVDAHISIEVTRGKMGVESLKTASVMEHYRETLHLFCNNM